MAVPLRQGLCGLGRQAHFVAFRGHVTNCMREVRHSGIRCGARRAAVFDVLPAPPVGLSRVYWSRDDVGSGMSVKEVVR
jgi:hypothetical protein